MSDHIIAWCSQGADTIFVHKARVTTTECAYRRRRNPDTNADARAQDITALDAKSVRNTFNIKLFAYTHIRLRCNVGFFLSRPIHDQHEWVCGITWQKMFMTLKLIHSLLVNILYHEKSIHFGSDRSLEWVLDTCNYFIRK